MHKINTDVMNIHTYMKTNVVFNVVFLLNSEAFALEFKGNLN